MSDLSKPEECASDELMKLAFRDRQCHWNARSFARWGAIVCAFVLAITALIVGSWWLLHPRPLVGAEALDSLSLSFEYSVPPLFSEAVGTRPILAPGLFVLADPNYNPIIAISVGYPDDQVDNLGVLPDYSGEAVWGSPDISTIQVRGEDTNLYKYNGVRESSLPFRAWVFSFLANDGWAKVSIMGDPDRFSEPAALEFIYSIR